MIRTTVFAASIIALTSSAHAGVSAPIVENFDNDSANWADAFNQPLAWSSAGGPDGAGDGFASSSFNFANSFEGDQVSLFRGHADFGSSNGEFVGDWLSNGISEFSFWIRHDHIAPLNFFARFASPINFPGTIGLTVVPVLPNTWTQLTIALDPNNPLIIPEGGPGTFEATFANVGNVQMGLQVDAGLAGFDSNITFDLDNIVAVPAPACLPLMAMVGVMARRRRRDLA